MGQLTRAQIVLQGLQRAGRTDLTERATEALRNWLRSQYRAWPFWFLRQSREALALPAGTTALKVGTGEGGVTNEIQRILSPIHVYATDYSTNAVALITSLDQDEGTADVRVSSTSLRRGLPTTFKIRKATAASGGTCWQLVPNPVPDRSYLLTFDYIELPTDAIPSTSTIPLYPNDQTMVMAVEAFAFRYSNGPTDPDYMAAAAEVSEMVKADRIKDGQQPGTNDVVSLASDIYR